MMQILKHNFKIYNLTLTY